MAEVTLDSAPQKVRDLYNKGSMAIDRGNLDYAVDLLTLCVEAEPEFMAAWKLLRVAEIKRFRQKKTSILKQLFSRTTGLSSYVKTAAMMQTDKTPRAIMAAEKLLRDAPLDSRYIKLFAQAAANADLPAVAILTLEIARDSAPDDISTLNWLGTLYLKVGRTRSARECFERLCELCPNDPTVLKSLKDALAIDSMATDKWTEVSETSGSFRELIKDTKEAELLEQDSKAVKTEKDVDALIADTMEKLTKEPGNINYYRHLARLYAQKKMFGDAINTLRKALQLNPGDPELDGALSQTRVEQLDDEIAGLREAGDTKRADAKQTERDQFVFNDLQERVKRYPNDLSLRYEWGIALFSNDYLNEAIQQLQMSQRSPKHRVRSLFHLALAFCRKKQYDLAREQMEKANMEVVSMDQTKKDILYELGGINELMGEHDKALACYKQIYAVDIGYKDVASKVEKAYDRESGGFSSADGIPPGPLGP